MTLLKTEEAARYCGYSKSSFDKMRMTGSGPTFVKLGAKVSYRQKDLDEWIESGLRNSTSEART